MRAVRISVSWAGKSGTTLLGTRTAPCDAISEDFVALTSIKLFTARKANANNILDTFSVQSFVIYFVQTCS